MRFALALAAGLAASASAFCVNRRLIDAGGGRALWLAVPALEEVLKTGLAVLVGAPVVAAHLVFGAVEAVYDAGGRRRSHTAALLSLGTHGGFGFLTQLFAARGGFAAAVVAVAVIHALFNMAVLGAAPAAGRGETR